jgi:hypothetical protein
MKTDAASRGSPEQGGNWAMAGMRLGARPAECCMNVNAIVGMAGSSSSISRRRRYLDT